MISCLYIVAIAQPNKVDNSILIPRHAREKAFKRQITLQFKFTRNRRTSLLSRVSWEHANRIKYLHEDISKREKSIKKEIHRTSVNPDEARNDQGIGGARE